jgi:hypothetical protein
VDFVARVKAINTVFWFLRVPGPAWLARVWLVGFEMEPSVLHLRVWRCAVFRAIDARGDLFGGRVEGRSGEALHYGEVEERVLGALLELVVERGRHLECLVCGPVWSSRVTKKGQVGNSMKVMAPRGVQLLERENL